MTHPRLFGVPECVEPQGNLFDSQRFKEELAYWAKMVKPLQEEARRSEQLTGEDFALRINARDY
jgi:hypothetical protein